MNKRKKGAGKITQSGNLPRPGQKGPATIILTQPRRFGIDIAAKIQNDKLAIEDIDDNLISAHLSTNYMPDPDLLIRTGGEIRLSNYLLWQCAYSELYFCETFWPDFREEEFCKAIYDYQKRERRFGKTSEQI